MLYNQSLVKQLQLSTTELRQKIVKKDLDMVELYDEIKRISTSKGQLLQEFTEFKNNMEPL